VSDIKFEFVAVIERYDQSEKRFVPVPINQGLDFDQGAITRQWLHPYLKHLLEFLEVANCD
jgi:hypothetical protein